MNNVVFIENMMPDGTPLILESCSKYNHVTIEPQINAKTFPMCFSFQTRDEAERCFMELMKGTAQPWQYQPHLTKKGKSIMKEYNNTIQTDFTYEQSMRINQVYDKVTELLLFLTDGNFDAKDTTVTKELTECLAETLTKTGYSVHFPTVIKVEEDDEELTKIVDIYELKRRD